MVGTNENEADNETQQTSNAVLSKVQRRRLRRRYDPVCVQSRLRLQRCRLNAIASRRISNRESARRSREQKAQEREHLIAENMALVSQNKNLSSEADDLRAQLRKLQEEATPRLEYRRWVSPFAMVSQDVDWNSAFASGPGPRSESSLRSWLEDPLGDLENSNEALAERVA